MDEVDFNFGRLFHQLGSSMHEHDLLGLTHHIGLFSHAARHYERVLEMAEGRIKEDADVSLHNVSFDPLIKSVIGFWPRKRGGL
jgi:hypothetical protein